MAGDRQSVTERIRLAERRRQVFYLSVVRGLTAPEIAEVARISPRTVERDLRWMRSRLMHQLRQRAETAENVTDLVVEIDAALQAVGREAWASVAGSDPKSAQHVRALNTALASVSERTTFLQSLGLLKKVPDKLDMGLDLLGLSDEEIDHELAD